MRLRVMSVTTTKIVRPIFCLLIVFLVSDLATGDERRPQPRSTTSLLKTSPPPPASNVQELIVPLNSMTPLACSPILNLPLPRRATWFRDNRRIGSVNAASNLVLEGRAHFVESIPAVGLLLVPSVSLDDEGDYYCALDDNSDARSTTYRLRVAYIWPFAASARPLVRVAHDTITIECPKARAWPQPLILWRVNEGAIDFSNGHIEITANNSLLIRSPRSSDAAYYRCISSNYAGEASAVVELTPREILAAALAYSGDSQTIGAFECAGGGSSTSLSTKTLWFLVGCMSTSCVVLVYMLSGLVCYKFSSASRRAEFAPLHSLLQADPSLAPGFRKVIAPTVDVVRRPPPPPLVAV